MCSANLAHCSRRAARTLKCCGVMSRKKAKLLLLCWLKATALGRRGKDGVRAPCQSRSCSSARDSKARTGPLAGAHTHVLCNGIQVPHKLLRFARDSVAVVQANVDGLGKGRGALG